MISGFIWDLDGVITDTSDLHRQAWIETLNFHLKDKGENNLCEKYDQFFSGVPRINKS